MLKNLLLFSVLTIFSAVASAQDFDTDMYDTYDGGFYDNTSSDLYDAGDDWYYDNYSIGEQREEEGFDTDFDWESDDNLFDDEIDNNVL